MKTAFKAGDHVRWNSEAGIIHGTVKKIHTADTDFRGRTRHASPEEPQFEVESDKTGHLAMHKGSALTRVH